VLVKDVTMVCGLKCALLAAFITLGLCAALVVWQRPRPQNFARESSEVFPVQLVTLRIGNPERLGKRVFLNNGAVATTRQASNDVEAFAYGVSVEHFVRLAGGRVVRAAHIGKGVRWGRLGNTYKYDRVVFGAYIKYIGTDYSYAWPASGPSDHHLLLFQAESGDRSWRIKEIAPSEVGIGSEWEITIPDVMGLPAASDVDIGRECLVVLDRSLVEERAMEERQREAAR
jgi:hypothetical protein